MSHVKPIDFYSALIFRNTIFFCQQDKIYILYQELKLYTDQNELNTEAQIQILRHNLLIKDVDDDCWDLFLKAEFC
jgi:hypothetical protein